MLFALLDLFHLAPRVRPHIAGKMMVFVPDLLLHWLKTFVDEIRGQTRKTEVTKGLNLMNREVAERVLELSRTGLEGLEYVRDQISLGKYEQSMAVFSDVVHAFSEIEDVLSTYQGEQDSDNLLSATSSLRDGFNWMVKAYEERGRLQEILHLTLMVRYKAWQRALEESLSRYIVS